MPDPTVDLITYLKNSDEIIKSLSATDNNAFEAGILYWKNWRKNKDKLKDAILTHWHLRIFSPNRDEKYSPLTEPEPFGDTVYILEISRACRWDLAEAAAKTIQQYANDNSHFYRSPLRIRCFLLETVNAYLTSLNNDIDKITRELGKRELTNEEQKELLIQLQKISEEINVVSTSAEQSLQELENRTTIEKKEVLSRTLRDIMDMCLQYDQKIINEVTKENVHIKTLIRTWRNYNE